MALILSLSLDLFCLYALRLSIIKISNIKVTCLGVQQLVCQIYASARHLVVMTSHLVPICATGSRGAVDPGPVLLTPR